MKYHLKCHPIYGINFFITPDEAEEDKSSYPIYLQKRAIKEQQF